MGQAQINVRTRACSGTFIARTKQAALTHNVRGKELKACSPIRLSQTLSPNDKASLLMSTNRVRFCVPHF